VCFFCFDWTVDFFSRVCIIEGIFFLLQKNDSSSGLFYFILKVYCTRRRLSNLWRKSKVIQDAFLGPIFICQWSGAADIRRVAFLVAVVFYGAALVSPTPNPPPFSSWTWDQAMVELTTQRFIVILIIYNIFVSFLMFYFLYATQQQQKTCFNG